ncbi:MAG: hypothetical protein GXP03_13355 [Alphaproteobacteria bacterium]|nr:hypothetical protein [Alphaproteobacteria bacterium]
MNAKFAFAAIALAALPTSGNAQECRAINNDLDRLGCYDKESGRTPETTTIPTTNAWDVSVKKSEMTDDTTVSLMVFAQEPIQCRSYGTGTKPVLVLRCLENRTVVYITTDCHLTSSDYSNYGDVTYRLDETKAITKGFTESTDNKALGLWRGSSAIPFIKAMFSHDQMLTRFTPYSENAVTAKFDIAGLEESIKPLREACNW